MMIPYLLHSSILLTGCFIFYWLLIRQETFFKLNRWVLISSIALSLLIPLIQMPESWSLRQATATEIQDAKITTNEVLQTKTSDQAVSPPKKMDVEKTITAPLSELQTEKTPETTSSLKSISLTTILWNIYLTGVAVFFLAFLVQLFILLTKMYSYISYKDGRYRIVELVKDEAPYSFWNSIFINPAKYDLETFTQIIDHEKIHIRQAHFFDKLLAEALLIAFWFNPFVWFLRNAITNNLEYLTDSSMLESGTEKQRYQLSLLQVSVPQHPLNLSTNYNNSFLKSRIAMMNSKKSSASSSWKYLFLLPLIGFSMICLNEVQSKEAKSLTDLDQTVINRLDTIPEEPTNEEEFEAMNEFEDEPEAPSESEEAYAEMLELEEGFEEMAGSEEDFEEMAEYEETEESEIAYHSNTDVRPGHWVGEIDGNNVCFELNNSRPAKGWTSISHECFKRSELSDLPMGEDKDFYIKRAAGTLNFNGSFKGDFGDGTFEFEEDATFLSYLEKEGMRPQKESGMYHLFLNDVNKDYIASLRSQGFQPDGDDLVELSVHSIDKDEINDFVGIFKDLDYKGYKVRDLIQFKIHDVNPEYVNEIRAQGMTDLTVQEIVQAKIHDVDPDFIKSVRDYGLDVNLQEVIQFSIHDVDVEYIEKMKKLGFRDLSHQEIIQSSIHDVSPDYIQEIHEAGFTDMDMNELIQFSIHDIDAELIKSFKGAGFDNLSSNEIIQAGIHDVDPDFIKELQAYGMKGLDMGEIVQMAIHDVDADYLKEMKALGFRDMDTQEIIQAKIHDVDPDFIKDLQAQGLGDMDMQDIVQFAIHDISAKDIKAFKAAGFDLNTQDIINAGIHNVSAKYIEQMRALGFEDADLDDFIDAKIHGVNPSFIKRAREKGHNPKTLKEYVKLKIGGI